MVLVGPVCVYDIKLISAPARWSPIGRCRGDYAPTIAAGDCIGEEVVVEVGERGCRWVTGAGERPQPAGLAAPRRRDVRAREPLQGRHVSSTQDISQHPECRKRNKHNERSERCVC